MAERATPRHDLPDILKRRNYGKAPQKKLKIQLFVNQSDFIHSDPGDMVDLTTLATEALEPLSTDNFFLEHRALFTEVCARWIQSNTNTSRKVAAFGRILPLAPHLAEHVEQFLSKTSDSALIGSQTSAQSANAVSQTETVETIEVLLGTIRLLSYDCRNFAKYVRSLAVQSLFRHPDRVVRYLAVRTLCVYVHAADHATQEMIKRTVGAGALEGLWEGQEIDYRFLSLWEEKRWKNLQARLHSDEQRGLALCVIRDLSPFTVNVNGILLPRLAGAASLERPADLVSTSTTDANLQKMAHGLLGSKPLLLTGLAGSGKTLLVRHLAWQLNKLDQMVTLHLNEQSDAKLLIGMYATGARPGTFSWRPGVLTTAVKEGRWIFIEDLDRAPNEIISTLLPLIERGELLIPSRGETVRAARGFRIIATMRSTLNPRGQEIVPRQNMIGHRFWNSIKIQMPTLSEFEQVINHKFPALQKHLVGILQVYSRLLHVFADPKFVSDNGTSIRAITSRDLFKWCDRIAVLLSHASSFNAAQKDDIFMEASDCFAGSLRSEAARAQVMARVAEELHIDPQRRDHLLRDRTVKLSISPKNSGSTTLQIGRARLSKHKVTKRTRSDRPFSTNDFTLRLLEKITVAVDREEPLLLVGETGTGKTTCIQYLAEQLGRKLVTFNLSQQSESGDLLGGYKPVNVRSLVIPLKDEFDEIFDTTFSRKKNLRFLEMLGKRIAKGEWKRVCTLWREALKMVDAARKAHESQTSSPDPDGGQPKKRRKMDSLPANFPTARWEKFAIDLHDLEAQLSGGSEAFAFSFLEGNIVKAVRNGDWILLDEINLASSDTLEALTDLLGGGPDGNPSILLTETGNVERVVAHPNFRVFAAMNPATDVGKKDLPPGVRSRFTELYVESPDSDEKSLRSIVEKYLGGDGTDPVVTRVARDVTNLYLEIQQLAKANMLVDGADQKPHFSLRTLTRTLFFTREIAPLCSVRRALYEGFNMSFLTFLSKASEDIVAPLITKHLFPQRTNLKTELGKPLQHPLDGRDYVREGHYWLRQGLGPVEEQAHYIITPFVQRNMNNLIRAASTRKYPVLIQGPTSSGKTSMIEYLARRSGNKFVRINNHEHTDLQEYLGTYISGVDGKLIFQEGILVRALREGHWIVLDELNLAPTDVLEALNRLLDDNRELLIPETQEVVRPHADFMLFATQNPAGLYGGRKVLSRAFRNRFLELHFDDIPVDELTEILHRRTRIPETWCKRVVQVYRELSTLRQENRIFEQKSFATLRDLFRWAQRRADTIQDLANNGYMLLAERVRKEEERVAVKEILEKVMSEKGPRVTIDEEIMFSGDSAPDLKHLSQGVSANLGDVVWTRAMRRLFVLVSQAVQNNEPVLLVGETGCGKTTVCQLLADHVRTQLHIVNAHQNTETGDLIGAQRPVRNRAAIEDQLRVAVSDVLTRTRALNPQGSAHEPELDELLAVYDKIQGDAFDADPVETHELIKSYRARAAALFEWADGSLVHAMKHGHFFLLDEISLADDSVLERLNSVLEPSRTLLLAEKGPTDSFITAMEGFQFLATMNPGGDFGKKELSPALRNRFTEIWVPAMSDHDDILQIVRSKLCSQTKQHAGTIVSFSQWFNDRYNTSVSSSISIRDTLAWVSFVNKLQYADPVFAIVHGAAMVFIDTLGANPAGLLAIPAASVDNERKACLNHLSKLVGQDVTPLYFSTVDIISTDEAFQVGPFAISKFASDPSQPSSFALQAPTTCSNAMRVVRALQLAKPILLEGNPGVGKTTLITALAQSIGKPLTRLNLSEQTDLMDLFGSDVPIEGGAAGTFAWRDAPFLKAMKNGDWVLLDEMNLASQSVLEGLNAVLDHRGEVYISELDQKFYKHKDFQVFAAQNPHHQGGGRKGLPASFVNRFTVVYADVFHPEDLALICRKVFPNIEEQEVGNLIRFVAEVDHQVVTCRAFGHLGAPWEFNLRDTLRWLQLLASNAFCGSARDFLDTIFVQRFRSEGDRTRLMDLFEREYGCREQRKTLYHTLSPYQLQVGLAVLDRDQVNTQSGNIKPMHNSRLEPMEALLVSIRQSWPAILVGAPGSGKTAMIDQLASLIGANLVTFAMNADIDAMDLVGGYEQVDPSRETHRFIEKLTIFVRQRIALADKEDTAYLRILEYLQDATMESTTMVGSILETLALSDTAATALLKEYHEVVESSAQQIDGARFQWVDGILVRALEQGKWLVLDNANLCSSAVLDRLNSLLEPNGYLSINEHSTADGEARIIYPHPSFRIFMTMDPRFGELSRAMRNRAVEICLLTTNDDAIERTSSVQYPLESAMYRFRHIQEQQAHDNDSFLHHFENLGFEDTDLLIGYTKQIRQGLLASNASLPMNGETHLGASDQRLHGSCMENPSKLYEHLSQFFKTTWIPDVLASLGENPIASLQLQSYHPLGNEILLHRNETTLSQGLWLASMYEVMLDVCNMRSTIQNLPTARFERRKERQKLPAFLYAYQEHISKVVADHWVSYRTGQLVDLDFLKPLRALFWAFVALTTSATFDRATFHTYLKMLMFTVRNERVSSMSSPDALSNSLLKQLAVFGSDVQLTTGLGMERIWRVFKPVTSSTTSQLSSILDLESLADRLDKIMWSSSMSMDTMILVRERISGALDLVRTNQVEAGELLVALGSVVQELEQGISEDDTVIVPYFEEEFEGLCQFLDVVTPDQHQENSQLLASPIKATRARSAVFARRPTKLATISQGTLTPADNFARASRYLGLAHHSGNALAMQGLFHISVFNKLLNVDDVRLAQLDRFENELQVLSQHTALDAGRIAQGQHGALRHLYNTICQQLVTSHADVLRLSHEGNLEFFADTGVSEDYQRTIELGLSKSFAHKQSGKEAFAWIELGLLGIRLYVPNYPHDPALKPMIERKMFNEEKLRNENLLEALRQFQRDFTGQSTSLRIRLIERALLSMGQEPSVPAVVRPEISELDDLQGEFTNLLSIVRPLLDCSLSLQDAAQDNTLQQNMLRVLQRLSQGYRAYDDITDTVIGFVVCLAIGLVLARKEQDDEISSTTGAALRHVREQTPFFGREQTIENSQVLLTSLEEGLNKGIRAIDTRWHALQSLTILQKTDPAALGSDPAKTLLHALFTSFYGDWKTKLLEDQETEARNSSLYTYRGVDEDGDAEDPTLFPDYEIEQDDDDMQLSVPSDSREHAIRVANMHATLFMEDIEASEAMKTLLGWCATELNRVCHGKHYGTTHEDALPAIYLILQRRSEALTNSGIGQSYNFYFDANLHEAKRLISLIHRIQTRYRQIRNVWPEHATLSEVLRTCEETLQFRHVDPVAKFITKAEKLHAYMHEWEKVASKEFSASNLYDDLTRMLVSWRQLELTTWAKLFDMEAEKCCDDAKSWFFVAYETIIAAADNENGETDIKMHAKQLLKSLEGFFETTTLGQFEQRMKLLRQLRLHAAMRAERSLAFKVIDEALDNFIAYFSRLLQPVQEALVKGRQALEKDVKDVIKLASWKDINIEALKQSAKTSHRKLTKLVRKFRALVNQPVAGLVKAGFPDENHMSRTITLQSADTTVPASPSTLILAQLPEWDSRPTRFKNLEVTVAMMCSLATSKGVAVDGATYIADFVSDLTTSMLELQKATPSTLTEENKEKVQHLKTQKRKLYADTMKELRLMGVNSNLSVDTLAKQDELSTILATLQVIQRDRNDGIAAEYHLHKALNIFQQVRAVYKEHSGDLTANDVARSIGYLEGLLQISVRQRNELSKVSHELRDIQRPLAFIKNLAQHVDAKLSRVSEQQAGAQALTQPRLRWLAAMLKTGAEIVTAQARSGKTNELDALICSMREWSSKIDDLADQYDKLPILPGQIHSSEHTLHSEAVGVHLSEFEEIFQNWIASNDMSRTILRQIEPFLFQSPIHGAKQTTNESYVEVKEVLKDIFGALDMVLGSMQDVEAAIKTLPASNDDAAWLIKEEQSICAALSSLHTAQISNDLENTLEKMRLLESDQSVVAIAAAFASIQPILRQYTATHEFLIARFDSLHISTTALLHRLCKSFIQIGTQGFCQPPEKSSDQQPGKDDKLESGTGLGEGEGAEDISKDIEDDEDLEELAQEQKGEREGSIEEQDDAVDMGDQEMEGQTEEVGEKEEKGDESGEEGDDDVQSEVGSVDDLGPSAVDEKMWDEGGKDDASNDKETKDDVGTENQEEQVAADQKEKPKETPDDDGKGEDGDEEKDGEDDDDEMEGEDQNENVGVGETEQMDPHAKEEETLDLPEDLNMDGQDDDGKDDDFDDTNMGDDLPEDDLSPDTGPDDLDTLHEDIGPEQEGEDEQDTTGHIEDKEQPPEDREEEEEEEGDEPMDDDAAAIPDDNGPDDEINEAKDTDQADHNADAGAGMEANQEAHTDRKHPQSASAANQDEGQEGDNSEQKQDTVAEDGQIGQTAAPDAGGRGEQPEESQNSQSFKKLGDMLEKWYNQQKQISEAREKDESQVQQIEKEIDMADADFEHLDDEEARADTQALGTATEEQAAALNHDMAMPVNEDDNNMPIRPEDRDEEEQPEDVDMAERSPEGLEQPQEQQQHPDSDEGRPQTFVGEQKSFSEQEDQEMEDAVPIDDDASQTSSVQEVETQLELTHLDDSAMKSENARALWLSHEAATHSLSQQLTEHLRLILAPTLATKLRGDFRTGKRLNLKRIIPYIASGYKRDKIWLRRSQPSKRSYQVMIALDDSKSMAESGSANLALKTLTLVTKSLSMLEVGEVSVVGFGDQVNVAHDFDKPFTSEAGVQVFEQFGFGAAKTNVRGLVDKSLELFAEARRKGSSSAGEELWQLMLIVSDGICDSHAEIQRLVRKAQEERVMIVFIIIDSSASGPATELTSQSPDDPIPQPEPKVKEKENTSILDLQSVEITSEGKVVRWKYMEKFPFRYYLVVRDVRELPGVLAGALRQWFGEVAGSA
ncbi:AAA ATPase midasin [Coniothyrium glycines]